MQWVLFTYSYIIQVQISAGTERCDYSVQYRLCRPNHTETSSIYFERGKQEQDWHRERTKVIGMSITEYSEMNWPLCGQCITGTTRDTYMATTSLYIFIWFFVAWIHAAVWAVWYMFFWAHFMCAHRSALKQSKRKKQFEWKEQVKLFLFFSCLVLSCLVFLSHCYFSWPLQ